MREGPQTDQDGNKGDAVWANEGGVLLRVTELQNGGARFEIGDTTGAVLAKATIEPFRIRRIKNLLKGE